MAAPKDPIPLKQGDSFDQLVTIPADFADGHFAGWDVKSQLRNTGEEGAVIAELDVSWADPATTRTLRLLKIDTKAWPLGTHEFDVQFTRDDGYTVSTSTAKLKITKDVTAPATP